MAASTNRLSVLFLVFILAHSQVQARESKFFSKVTHFTTVATGDGVEEKKKTHVEIPVPPPEYSLAPSPAPAYVEKEYGYGLYGHDSDMLPPAKETFTPVTTTTTSVNEKETTTTPATATDDKDNNSEEQFVHEQLSGESFQTGYTNNNNNYNYNNNGYSNNDNYHDNNGYSNSENYYNKNGYGTERQGMSDTRYLENGKYNYNTNSKDRQTNGYANNYNTAAFTSTYSTTSQPENYNPNVYSGNYKSNEYGTERQGMSDTRYMENGKYYYHVKSENSYLNGYEPEKAATGNYANYEENSSNSNEFDTMEEYYRKQGYQESQEVEEP